MLAATQARACVHAAVAADGACERVCTSIALMRVPNERLVAITDTTTPLTCTRGNQRGKVKG
jgi:hypothetical protein